MAKITGIYTASHTPVMLNFPDRIPAALREESSLPTGPWETISWQASPMR
jgi:hypothetical protein